MADISMCEKKDCPSFNDCYRAQAIKNEYRQSYMNFDNGTDSCCDDYIPVKPIQQSQSPRSWPSGTSPPNDISLSELLYEMAEVSMGDTIDVSDCTKELNKDRKWCKP